MLSGRPLAATLLAWSLVKTTWARMFGRKTGLALFRENYDADRLAPVDMEDRLHIAAFSRCFACGLCDAGEGERIRASRGAYPGLMRVVLASSRSMPDFDAAVLALDHVPEEVLRRKEQVCPARVPFVELARFVRRKATVGPARPPPAPKSALPAPKSALPAPKSALPAPKSALPAPKSALPVLQERSAPARAR